MVPSREHGPERKAVQASRGVAPIAIQRQRAGGVEQDVVVGPSSAFRKGFFRTRLRSPTKAVLLLVQARGTKLGIGPVATR